MGSPINMQHSVLQTVITERIQQVQQQHPDMQQRYFEHQLSQERMKKLQKVNDFEQMEKIEFTDKEAEKRKRKDQQQSRFAAKPESGTAPPPIPDQPERIDVKA